MDKIIIKKMSFASIVSLFIGFFLGIIISLLLNIGTNWSNWSSFIPPIITLIIGLLFPLINIYLIKKAKLSIEISSISRQVSMDTTIFLDGLDKFITQDFYVNRRFRSQSPFMYNSDSEIKENRITLNVLKSFIDYAKREIKQLPDRIEKNKKELEKVESIGLENFNKYTALRLNAPLNPEIHWENGDFENDKESIFKQFVSIYKKQIDEPEKKLLDFQNNLPELERRFENINKELVDTKSSFTISTTLINSGRSSTSIKRPALLRIYIGQGNYVDLKLSLQNFETMSEVSTQATKIAIFESSEISSLPEDDRKLINTYWGQSVNSILYVQDIHGNVHHSNTISFAEGLYQKLIYDKLAATASQSSNFN